MPKVVHVYGLSGVGKSWLCARYALRHDVLHASASALLRRAKEAETGRETDSEELRLGPVLDNQELLVRGFGEMLADETGLVLFDGHNVVDDGVRLLEIPLDVVRRLRPDGIVFVEGDPAAIADRRARDVGRSRPARSVEVLARQQRIAADLARSHADALGVLLHTVAAGDEDGFAAAVA